MRKESVSVAAELICSCCLRRLEQRARPCHHDGTRKLEQAIHHTRRARWRLRSALGLLVGLQSVRVLSTIAASSLNASRRKQQVPHPRAQTPFDCCALSFQPFEHPVCARNKDGTGFVFDLVNIIPWLKRVPFLSSVSNLILHQRFQGNITIRTQSPKSLSLQTTSSSSTTRGSHPEKSTILFLSSHSANTPTLSQLR